MPHSIGLGMIVMDETADELLAGVLRERVVNPSDIHIAEADPLKREHYQGLGVDCQKDVSASMLRSEIILLSGDRREFSTLLSSICGTTRGRVVVSLVEGRDISYIQQRVAKATHVVSVKRLEQGGSIHYQLTYSKHFPGHMKSAVEDIFKTVGTVETFTEA